MRPATLGSALAALLGYAVAGTALAVVLPPAWIPIIVVLMVVGAVIEWRRGLVRRLWPA